MTPKKSPTVVVDTYNLEYRGGGSDKFYRVIISEDGTCILNWGRRGSTGQHSVSTLPSYADATDVGMRQVYAKKSKGYTQTFSGKFVIDAEVVRWAKEGSPHHAVARVEEARAQGEFSGVKDAVLIHYNDLAEKAQDLLNQAAEGDIDSVINQYESLEEAWEAIKDKHADVEVAMSIAKATFTKRLLGI